MMNLFRLSAIGAGTYYNSSDLTSRSIREQETLDQRDNNKDQCEDEMERD